MDSDVLIEVRNLSKSYRIFSNPQDRLKQKFFKSKQYYKDFWALKDINFDIRRGETFGIIGVNGSGKSTLLQILAGIFPPTEGYVNVNGKIAALLELGSGFNPEFTGRDNILVNASVLGLKQDEIQKRMESIISFADIGEFIDQPVKTYSSGMFVRLAFAVSTSVDAQVLLVDEALAVGDIFFRQKCYEQLNKLREQGTAIVLVSHSMGEIEQFCQHTLLLDAGESKFIGDSVTAVKKYYLVAQEKNKKNNTFFVNPENQSDSIEPDNVIESEWVNEECFLSIDIKDQVRNEYAQLEKVGVTDIEGNSTLVFYHGQEVVFHYEFLILKDITTPIGGVVLFSDKMVIVHGKNTLQMDTCVPNCVFTGDRLRFSQTIKLDIQAGEYTFEVGLAILANCDYKSRKYMSSEILDEKITRISHISNLGPIIVLLNPETGFTLLDHYGVANLPGSCKCFIKKGNNQNNV